MSKYTFKPYNQKFPRLYAAEQQRIMQGMSYSCVIEHVGSTAVQGLGGKGIIDIALAADRNQWNSIHEILASCGYAFIEPWSTPERHFFKITCYDSEHDTQVYHVHLTDRESSEWSNFITFRDYLRKNPDAVTAYEQLKIRAVEAAQQNGEIYRALKDPFIRDVLIAAKNFN